MPSIGPLEIVVVAVIALLVFGPEKLPEIARTIGRAAGELRRMAADVRDEFDVQLQDLDLDEQPEPSEPAKPKEPAEQAEPTEPAEPGEETEPTEPAERDESPAEASTEDRPES